MGATPLTKAGVKSARSIRKRLAITCPRCQATVELIYPKLGASEYDSGGRLDVGDGPADIASLGLGFIWYFWRRWKETHKRCRSCGMHFRWTRPPGA